MSPVQQVLSSPTPKFFAFRPSLSVAGAGCSCCCLVLSDCELHARLADTSRLAVPDDQDCQCLVGSRVSFGVWSLAQHSRPLTRRKTRGQTRASCRLRLAFNT